MTTGYDKAVIQKSQMLTDWLTANNVSFDEAIPILAVTAGSIIKIMACDAPPNEHQAYLQEGIEIACAIIRAVAEDRDRQ